MTLTNDNISVRNNCMQLSGNFCLKIALKLCIGSQFVAIE